MNFKDFKERYQKKEVLEFPSSTPKDPVISVLVQTYRQKDFIKQCLDSILMQETFFSFEILVGEDGSDDGTREICIEYAEEYPEKIRLFLHNRENQIKVLGEPTSNFNAFYNFYSARGNYIAFCEGDDKWGDSQKLQKQVELLKANSALAFAYHSYIEVNEEGEAIPKIMVLEQPTYDISKSDLKQLSLHPLLSTICFKNHIKENIPEEMAEVINVDSFLISLLGNYGSGGYIANIKPSYYRRHLGGMWSGKVKELRFKSKINTFQKLISYYTKKKEHITVKALKNKHGKIYKQFFLFYVYKGEYFKSLKSLLKIL